MSHEIQEHDVQEGIEQAWHGLTQVNPDMSMDNNWLRTWDYESRPVLVNTYMEIESFGPESETNECFEDLGWPGDGSGTDDLADFNANEVNDYLNE